MEKLLAGYRRFRARDWPERRGMFQTLAQEGQRPHVLVVGCIDSRVDPAVIFDMAPGEMLTVRNVANLVPPYEPDIAYHGTSAALEFGIRVLQVRNVLVLGHESCGGVQALLEGAPDNARDFIAPWMSMAAPARERALHAHTPGERRRLAEQEVVKISLTHLMSFPWIAEAVRAGELALHGAWFSIAHGTLSLLQPDGSFEVAE